jgi:hypothetical protein
LLRRRKVDVIAAQVIRKLMLSASMDRFRVFAGDAQE